MSGRIIAEYEDYSLWESELSPQGTFVAGWQVRSSWPQTRNDAKHQVAYTQTIRVKTYCEALLEPEWEIFV